MDPSKDELPGEAPKARKPAKRDFTDRFLKSIKPAPVGRRVIYYDTAVRNFGIRVSEKSTKANIGTFVLVTRFPRGRNPVARRIGDYPTMSLAEAHEIAREWQKDIRQQHIDPKVKEAERRQQEAELEAKRQREEANLRENTFAAVFAKFDETYLAKMRSGKAIKSAIERRVLPHWMDKPITEIRAADIRKIIDGMEADAPIAANRLVAYLKKFFSWAVEKGFLEMTPAATVKRPTKEKDRARDRILSDVEIRLLWQACDTLAKEAADKAKAVTDKDQAAAQKATAKTRAATKKAPPPKVEITDEPFWRAVKIMLLTGQRRNEVGRMKWSEVDRKQKLWLLPKERTKAKRASEVPLSDAAMAIIDDCPRIGEFVFTTGRSGRGKAAEKGAKPVPIAGWGKSKAKLDKAIAELAAKESAETGEPIVVGAWHLHDLRRSCATNLADLGTARIVLMKILNHSEIGPTKVYDLHKYRNEKMSALNAWAARLTSIVAETNNGGNVVQLDARR